VLLAQENESTTVAVEEIRRPKPSKRKRKEKEKEFDANAWMVTFGDLITLMMTFFVLLYSLNDPNPKTIEALSNSSPGLFSLSQAAIRQEINIQESNSLQKENLEIFLSENNIENIDVSQNEEGLLITLPTDLVFQKDSALLGDESKIIIQKITSYLKKTELNIRVEGHTDSGFVPNNRYTDTWALSLDRAHSILQEMLKTGIPPKRLSLVGKGSTQPKFTNLNETGRSKNRRVEIVVLKSP